MNKHADEDQASRELEDFGKQLGAGPPRIGGTVRKTTLHLSDEAGPNLRRQDTAQALRSAADQLHCLIGHLDRRGRAQA